MIPLTDFFTITPVDRAAPDGELARRSATKANCCGPRGTRSRRWASTCAHRFCAGPEIASSQRRVAPGLGRASAGAGRALLILGDQIEINLVRALMTDDNLWLFLTRPISGAMLGLSVASVLIALWQHRRSQQRAVRSAEPDVDF